jgi:CheY-like chemotaxis protein
MASVLICAAALGTHELGRTLLWRKGIERVSSTGREDALLRAAILSPSLIVVDHDLPEAERLVRELRSGDRTRSISIAVVARGDFDAADLQLMEAGANAILRFPVNASWDERLASLISVPPRRSGRIPLQLKFEGTGGTLPQATAGTALNLSEHGMLVETDVGIPLGADLDFRLHLPGGGKPLRGCGQTVRVDTPLRSGVRFYALGEGGLTRVRQFVTG